MSTPEEVSGERIMFKNNRRIDPETGQARVPAETVAEADERAGHTAPIGDSAEAAGIAAAQAEAAERTADLQRLTAEYANYRKRVERDKQAARELGEAKVITELLAICDDLDRAAEHGDLTGGFKTVADKFTGILQNLGLERYGAENDPFDPAVHEAVQFATAPDVTEQVIGSVMRVGYQLGGRVLRAAVVAVTGPEEESETTAEDEAND